MTTTLPPRPATMPLTPAGLPDDPIMREARFVVWGWTWNAGKGKWDKPPLRPVDGRAASVTNPADQTDLPRAIAAVARLGLAGIGVVLTGDEGVTGLDLDKCRDPLTRAIAPWAQAIIDRFGSYWEPSASGTGIRIFIRAVLPPHGRRKGPIEMYDAGRYLTINGNPGPGASRHFEERQAELDAWHAEVFPPAPPVDERRSSAAPPPPLDLDDEAVFARIAASKRGDEFYRLHRGDSHLTSASEGDFAYLGDLRFWWRGDPAGMRRIALTSGRVRDKWFTRRGTVDWLDYSIANSLKGPYEVHDPQRATGSRVVFDIPDEGAAQDGAGIAAALAERDAVIVRLQAEVERLDGQLGRCGQERERLVAENVALRSENGALREAAAYPDQTVGGIVVDLADYLIARAEKGDTVAHEGGEAVCVVQGQIPTQRSYSTVNRGFNKIMSVGHVPHFTRAIHIANERVEKDIEVPHIYISAEERADRGKLIRRLLPPKPEPKKHGGNRRKFDLPDFGAPVEGPVKIVTEKKRLYSSVVTEKVLKVETLDSHTEYCDEGGYQMTAAEVDQFKEGVGLKVRVPAYRPQPAQQPLAPADAALTAAMSPESFAAWLDEEPPPPIPLHGPRCAVPGCPFPPEEGRLCGRHAATCAMTGAD